MWLGGGGGGGASSNETVAPGVAATGGGAIITRVPAHAICAAVISELMSFAAGSCTWTICPASKPWSTADTVHSTAAAASSPSPPGRCDDGPPPYGIAAAAATPRPSHRGREWPDATLTARVTTPLYCAPLMKMPELSVSSLYSSSCDAKCSLSAPP